EARHRDATPALITPVSRRSFSDQGVLKDTHGDYPAVVKEVAAEYDVPLIDLHAVSIRLLTELGVDQSENLFIRAPAGVYKGVPKGKSDNTHFSRYGAYRMAQLVVEEIIKLDLPVARFLSAPPQLSQEGEGKVVGLDYYYNCEFKKNSSGDSLQFHYIWEDRENSGFSQWGDIFENTSAAISKVRTAPDAEILQKLSVYIIVDPDTSKENPTPHYLQQPAIDAIVAWVKEGGVLLLMGNDDGNAEFEHFNHLATQFGLYFNKVSVHRVEGKKYDMGQFVDLPDHPIFAGVGKIYMKEISTLTLMNPAQPVLSENGDIAMAEVVFGDGYVLAVGDPWLYNEYIDHRRLPPDFNNKAAAINLSKWLLSKAKRVR
ncbi:hypothetical protein JXO59_16020, partial [candidate division KSB1 bacterium]|nr:hypothetical protein [candidate division KSB1 bacterium]